MQDSVLCKNVAQEESFFSYDDLISFNDGLASQNSRTKLANI